MKVILIDTNAVLVKAWKAALSDMSYVRFYSGTLDSLPQGMVGNTGAVVSPGNSFGYLGGGFDLALQRYFGGKSFERFFRLQLGPKYKHVGGATVVDLDTWSKNNIKYMVHVPTVVAPTRRIFDEKRPIETGYQLVFDATWNALTHTPQNVDTLIIPGLGTGYVGVPITVCCKAMAFAIRLYFAGENMSNEFKNVAIMQFLGYSYNEFFPVSCKEECIKLGIDFNKLKQYDVRKDPIQAILPPC